MPSATSQISFWFEGTTDGRVICKNGFDAMTRRVGANLTSLTKRGRDLLGDSAFAVLRRLHDKAIEESPENSGAAFDEMQAYTWRYNVLVLLLLKRIPNDDMNGTLTTTTYEGCLPP